MIRNNSVLAQSTEIPTLQKKKGSEILLMIGVSRFHRSIEDKLKKLQFESLLLSDLEPIPHVTSRTTKVSSRSGAVNKAIHGRDFRSAWCIGVVNESDNVTDAPFSIARILQLVWHSKY